MGLTEKLVLESEYNKRIFLTISQFLKEMGWWAYWKMYLQTKPRMLEDTSVFVEGMWFCPRHSIYSIFGSMNFSQFLREKCKEDLRWDDLDITVFGIFIVYMELVYNDNTPFQFDSTKRRTIDYLKSKGIYQRWQEKLKLLRNSALESQRQVKSPLISTRSRDYIMATSLSPRD